MPEVSIIIVSWNAREELASCLESLPSGAGSLSYEAIVVDNASTDGSAKAVLKAAPKARLIRESENLGFAKANNIGIRQSRSRYVCLVNSDAVALAGSIEKLFRFMEGNARVAAAGPMVLNSDMTLQRSCRRLPSLRSSLLSAVGLDSLNYYPGHSEQEVEALSGCFIMVRREAIDEVGLLDERFFFYAEDKDWCKRFRSALWKVAYVPEARVVHHGGKSSSAAPVRFYLEMHKANLSYWKKHRSYAATLAYLALTAVHQSLRVIKSAGVYVVSPSRREAAAHGLKRSAACLGWLATGAGIRGSGARQGTA